MRKYEFSNDKSSKKSKVVSVVLHLIVLSLLGIPFLIQNEMENEVEEVHAVLLNFDSGSRQMGAQSKVVEKVEMKNTTNEEQVEKEDVKVVENNESKSVVVSDDADVERVEVSDDKSSEFNEVVEEVVADANAGQNNKSEGEGSGDGTSVDGSSDSGEGMDSEGDGMFEGIGVLERKIIHRPNLKLIAKEEGVVSFVVCVNRDGVVTDVEIDRALTTFKDIDTINKTKEIAKEFLFEKKNQGASIECGRLQVKITYA